MNNLAADATRYAATLQAALVDVDLSGIDIFVLPPFTSLPAAAKAFAGTPVAIGGQNMHWAEAGAWTGEISAAMLKDAGCAYVELAHAERLSHFAETYEHVRLKVAAALKAGLTPVLCLGESLEDKQLGRADEALALQLATALADIAAADLSRIVLAYEPRWAIGVAEAASADYVAARHRHLRTALAGTFGPAAAEAARIIYGGSVNRDNAKILAALPEVDGLFVGRHAWTGEGFAEIVRIVAGAIPTGDKS